MHEWNSRHCLTIRGIVDLIHPVIFAGIVDQFDYRAVDSALNFMELRVAQAAWLLLAVCDQLIAFGSSIATCDSAKVSALSSWPLASSLRSQNWR